MPLLSLNAKLDRTDQSTSWGFRLHGGHDFGSPLTIQRVTPGSLAANCGLQLGDAIMKIGDTPTDGMRHKEAQQTIMRCGNSLELTLQRGGGGGLSRPSNDYTPSSAPAPSSAFSPVQQPASSPYQQNYNVAPKPFQPGQDEQDTVPVALNKQYNTPIQMYSVGNVMDSLATQTGSMNLGQPSSDPVPPWRSGQGSAPAAPSSYSQPATGAAPGGGSGGGGTWQPKVPTGPRQPKLGKRGEARSMNAAVGRQAVCGGCGIQIRGPFVSALEKTWCPDHFICANPNCRVPLIDMGFVEEDGKLFCERDYEQYFAPTCGKCGRAIVGEVVNALKNTFHTNCFLCVQCRQPCGVGSFHMEDGKIYCPTDWAAMFQTKCYGCQFPIEPGDRWVEALSQNWHSECFNCSTCQVNLEGASFFAKGGRPYCKKHAGGGRF